MLLTSQSTQAATVLGAYAIVNTPLLNVRSGPGPDFPLLEAVTAQRSLPVIGRTPDCTWLQVVLSGRGPGWLAAEYVTLSQRCQDLPAITFLPPPPIQVINSTVVAPQAAAPKLQPAQASATEAPATVTSCNDLPNERYGALTIASAPTDRPAASHPDLNLSMRSYQGSGETAALLSFGPVHEIDHQAPQLRDLFPDRRTATVSAVYQVYDWNWGCNCRGDLLTSPPVTLVGFQVTPGERIVTPDSPRTIGDGYEALVLYATTDQVTLKFTREDNVIRGYTLHATGLCVAPALVERYTALDGAGRGQLPALRGGQAFGVAQGESIQIAIRDNGRFLDPRYLENWWR